ncbi:MAG: CvpA family protein [Hyphomicrobiaceae bacterium]
MVGSLSYLDIALLALCFISGILAMYRGLSREVLSILSWIVAAGATAWFIVSQKQVAEDVARQIGGGPLIVVQLGIGAIIFVIVLLIVHLFTSRISDAILDSRVGLIDRIGGFAFGVVRGFIIVLIVFMGYDHFVPQQDQFAFVRQAQSRELLLNAGKSIEPTLESLYNRFLNKEREPKPG